MEKLMPDPRSIIGLETPWIEVVAERQSLERYLLATGQVGGPYSLGSTPARWGNPILPPGFLGTMRPDVSELGLPSFGSVRLNAGNEYEWLVPVRAGETLQRKTRVVDAFERQGRSGTMMFVVMETTYRRPSGEVVARARATTIRR